MDLLSTHHILCTNWGETLLRDGEGGEGPLNSLDLVDFPLYSSERGRSDVPSAFLVSEKSIQQALRLHHRPITNKPILYTLPQHRHTSTCLNLFFRTHTIVNRFPHMLHLSLSLCRDHPLDTVRVVKMLTRDPEMWVGSWSGLVLNELQSQRQQGGFPSTISILTHMPHKTHLGHQMPWPTSTPSTLPSQHAHASAISSLSTDSMSLLTPYFGARSCFSALIELVCQRNWEQYSSFSNLPLQA